MSELILIQKYDSLNLRERVEAIVKNHRFATMDLAERAARKAVKWIVKNGKQKNGKPPGGTRNCIVMLAQIQKARAQDKLRLEKESKEANRLRNNPPPHDDVQELYATKEENKPNRADKPATG